MSSNNLYVPKLPRCSSCHRIRGIDYRVSEWGKSDDPLLFLLHGWGDAGGSFQFVVDSLESAWHVVAPDWRGFGESYCRAASYWFPDYIADLDALLGIYSPEVPARLVGHSMGANVAGLYAGIMPERVSHFVNVEGFGLADSDPVNAPAHYRRWIEAGRENRGYAQYRSFDELVPKIYKRSPRVTEDKAHFIARLWATQSKSGIELRADPAHKLPNAVQYRRAEAMACRARIEARVLLVTGEESGFFAAAKTWLDADQGEVLYPGAEMRVIPGAGHMVHFEQPARLAEAIEAFLQPDL